MNTKKAHIKHFSLRHHVSLSLNNKKAYSLIELLVTISILAVLVGIAVPSYLKYKDRSYRAWTISEMSHVVGLAKIAKQNDGWYHQFLYQLGYRPTGIVYAAVGSKADKTTNCCSNYPAIGATKCTIEEDDATEVTINSFSKCPPGTINSAGRFNRAVCASKTCTCKSNTKVVRYDYYSCKNTAPENAVNNIQICENYGTSSDSGCNLEKLSSSYKGASYSLSSTTKAQKHGTGNTCIASGLNPNKWCDCDNFYIAGESNLFKEKLSLNHSGQLCIGDGTTYTKKEF